VQTAVVHRSALLAERLRELRRTADHLLTPDSLGDLDEAIARLEDARCNVAVLGEFKRGQSTLVNALIEHARLPTDVLQATAVITVVRHGDGERIIVTARTASPTSDRSPSCVPWSPRQARSASGQRSWLSSPTTSEIAAKGARAATSHAPARASRAP
jgi:hypothetical protein